jgi:hypothetical protein
LRVGTRSRVSAGRSGTGEATRRPTCRRLGGASRRDFWGATQRRARRRRSNRAMPVRPGVSSFAADGEPRFRAIRDRAHGAGGGTRGTPSRGSFVLTRGLAGRGGARAYAQHSPRERTARERSRESSARGQLCSKMRDATVGSQVSGGERRFEKTPMHTKFDRSRTRTRVSRTNDFSSRFRVNTRFCPGWNRGNGDFFFAADVTLTLTRCLRDASALVSTRSRARPRWPWTRPARGR